MKVLDLNHQPTYGTGKDVAFSAKIFEEKKIEHWDGVRNHMAKNFMRDQMKFCWYSKTSVIKDFLNSHPKKWSLGKVPGIAAFAKVHREGYPDFTAWDSEHPYFDVKSNKEKPTWYMVDVEFISHLDHFISLKSLQSIATSPYDSLPTLLKLYFTLEDQVAIQSMPVLNRGRLSVQPVTQDAFEAIKKLAQHGDFELLMETKPKRGKGKAKRAVRESSDDDSLTELEDEIRPVRKNQRKVKRVETPPARKNEGKVEAQTAMRRSQRKVKTVEMDDSLSDLSSE